MSDNHVKVCVSAILSGLYLWDYIEYVIDKHVNRARNTLPVRYVIMVLWMQIKVLKGLIFDAELEFCLFCLQSIVLSG